MLLSMLIDGLTMQDVLVMLILIPVLLFSLTLHEYAHGLAAYSQGDHYAKHMGRLTLNPFKHLDPIGTACLLIVGFGWAKPVPIVPGNFKNGKASMLLVSLAGIATNLLLSILSCFLLGFFIKLNGTGIAWLDSVLRMTLTLFAQINMGLAVFNLIPIPPLDGYRVLSALVENYNNRRFFETLERYSTWILIGFLIISNRLNLLGVVEGALFDAIRRLVMLIL